MSDTDDEMTELYDADVPRLDLVGKGANGMPFLIAKSRDGSPGLFDADFVRGLVAKADARTPDDARETVTMSGSPAAIAAIIHGAPVRKAQMSTADINDLPDSAFAYIEPGGKKDESGKTVPRGLRHYPVHDEGHARNALGRAQAQLQDGDDDAKRVARAALPKIRTAAKKFGIEVSRETDGTVDVAEVVKDMDLDEDVDGMDPTVVLAAPEQEAPGDPADPGSPAWEAVDAATARKWTAILARARSALGIMADREMLEAAGADPGDVDAAWDLQDAACAIDYAIGILAPFAVDEQAESDCGTVEMEAIGKALTGAAAPLESLETYGALAKAGRTLSAANESAIRGAVQQLQQILASLPAAPDAPESGQAATMQKESEPMSDESVQAAMTDRAPLGTPKEPVAAETPAAMPDTAPVAKAAKAPQVAVYDANGNLVGVVDPAEITMIAPAKAPEPDGAAAAGDTDGTADGQTAPAPVTAADLTQAPADTVGTPADAVAADDDGNVAKAADNSSTTQMPQDVLKGNVAELVKAALDEHSAAQAEIVKTLEDRNRALEERNEALAKQAVSLEERLTKVENQPAVMAIASNGAIPPPHLMRGQDHGTPAALTKAQEMREAFKSSDDAAQQQALAGGLNALAIEELRKIHAAGPH